MTLASKAFTVLTEFRFEIQGAVAQSGVLQRSVEKISQTAEQSMRSITGYALAMAAGYFSVYKIISSAVYASEELTKSQLVLANIFSGQREYLTGPLDTFADRMQFAKQTLEDMSDVAKKFSLPEAELAGMTKLMLPVLVKAGVAGENMGGAIDLSRKYLKAAPTLGVDPGLAQGQMVSALTGAASLNDTLFRRLLTETEAFKEIAKEKDPTKKFNTMSEEKRFEMISKGLEQFSKDLDVVHGMTGLLSSKMQLLRDRLIGIKGILLPLGDAILPTLRVALDGLIDTVDTYGRRAFEGLAKLIRTFIGAPKTFDDAVTAITPFYTTLKQLAALQADVTLAGVISTTIALMLMAASVAKWVRWLGVSLEFLAPIVSRVRGVIDTVIVWIGFITAKLGLMTIVSKLLAFMLNSVLIPFLATTILLQSLSRAAAYAKVQDAKFLANPENMERLTKALARLGAAVSKILWPFYFIIDNLSKGLAPLFRFSTYFSIVIGAIELLAIAAEGLGYVLFLAMAGFQGFAFMIMQFFVNLGAAAKALVNRDFIGAAKIMAGTPGSLGAALGAGVDSFFEDNLDAFDSAKGRMKVTNSVTHINKVEIRQDFKENMEPDRIAHSVVRALGALAKNPTQSAGRSMEGALLNG